MEYAVKVEHLSKSFKLPHEKHASLKQAVLNFHRKTYEDLEVLKEINFNVKPGEFFGIVGRNGSGKSTLLKILAGIYQPSEGSVNVNGRLTPFIELGVGFNMELSGRDNVYLNGTILGLSKKEIDSKYHEIVAFAELEQFMDQKLKNYSSGMQVRLAFSIAIQAHSDILLIDEVLAVGDASFQRKCFKVFKEMKGKKTVIFISHDMAAVREYCDRAVLIENGQIISSGDPSDVANDYLQLFSGAISRSSNERRWGDRRAEISNIKVTVKKDNINLSYEVFANDIVENPICGVIIKDLDNNHIFDSNTKWKNVKTGTLKKGAKMIVSWSIPNIFRGGQYKVSPGVAHEDAVSFYDWQEDALTFTVERPEVTAGMILPGDKLLITKK